MGAETWVTTSVEKREIAGKDWFPYLHLAIGDGGNYWSKKNPVSKRGFHII
jgi:hypothetical protein